MSDTPITDREELCTTDYILPQFVVTSDICRELERENQRLKQTVLATLSQRGQKELIVAWDRVKELERENAALRKDKDRFDWLITKAPFCVLSTLSSDRAAARLKIDREMEFPTA